MKVIAGIVGGLLLAWSATLVAVLVGALLLPRANGIGWVTFLVAFAASVAFAVGARSASRAWSYLLSAAGVFWLASFAIFFAISGSLPIGVSPLAITETMLFVIGVVCLGIGWSAGRAARSDTRS